MLNGNHSSLDKAQLQALRELWQRALNSTELAFVKPMLECYRNRKASVTIALVGGIVRDVLLGHDSKDYDLIIEGIPLLDIITFLESGYGHAEKIESRNYGVTKFKPRDYIGGGLIDIAVPRIEVASRIGRAKDTTVETTGVTIADDFSRRDFTVNAMGLNLETGELVDPFQGLYDINQKIVRAVGDAKERFLEDPTRILRGVRLAVRFGFTIEESTWGAMKALANELDKPFLGPDGRTVSRVAEEKVGEEFARSLVANPIRTIELYDQLGLISKYLPEVAATKGVPQPEQYHSEGDVFAHTMMVLGTLPHNPPIDLVLSALFHDIGKVSTLTQDERGIHFHGHDKVSAISAGEILRRLKFKGEVIDAVKWLIGNHMTMLIAFPRMRPSKQKALARHPLFALLIQLATADARSSVRLDGSVNLGFLDSVNRVLERIKQEDLEQKPLQIIDGREVISELKSELGSQFSQERDGKMIGEILQAVNDLYQDGEITTKDQAREKVRELGKNWKHEL